MRFPATPPWGPLVVVPRHSWLRVLGAIPHHSWLGPAGCGPSPLLAEGPGCASLPLLAAVRCRWWWVSPRHSWLRVRGAVPRHSWLGSAGCRGGWSLATPGCGSWVRFPATPGWGPLVVVVGGPSPLLAEGPGCGCPALLAGVRCRWWWVVPGHSWLRPLVAVPRDEDAGCGGAGGLFRWGWVGGFPCCVCLWRGRVCVVLVCVLRKCTLNFKTVTKMLRC